MRLLRVLVAVALMAGICLVAPRAYACACGAMEPRSGAPELGVNSETAAIVFDGTTETIALSMALQTSSDQVALLLPLPTAATPRLGGEDLFPRLFDLTRPEIRYRYDYRLSFGQNSAGAAPGTGSTGGVQVLGHQRVGNYDVAQLTGSPAAVADWLAQHQFRTRPEVVAALGEYLDRGWSVLAATLVFDSPQFTGAMAPLVVSFPTRELVYPMKLSRLATTAQHLRFYVFTDHRVDVALGDRALPVTFAGRVDASTLRSQGYGAVADLLGSGEHFLTRVDGAVLPERITSDLQVTRAATDEAYREVTWVTVDRSWITRTVLAGVVGLLVVGGVVTAVVVRRRSRRRAAR